MILVLTKIFITGWIILLVAILLNILAIRVGIITWYPFLENVEKMGFVKSIGSLNFISKLFLFIIYPLSLGLTGFITLKMFFK